MSNLNASSLAAGVFNQVDNQVINPAPTLLNRKIVIVGVADATKLAGDLAVNTPLRVYSAEGVGEVAGYGSMIHRLAVAAYRGSQSLETWIIPQAEGGSDVAAEGTLTVTVTTVSGGTLYVYVGGELVRVTVAAGDTVDAIASSIASAINAKPELPLLASSALGVVTVTAKTKGEWGNDISVALNLFGEKNPDGVSVAVVEPAGGSGVADITPALTAMGTGDNSNEKHFTAMIHGYGKDNTTLDLIATYVGKGNDPVGCYDKINGRFFRSLIGSVANDLSAEVTFTDSKKLDRANGMLVVPNSPTHPAEIAAVAMGLMERKNNILAHDSYIDEVLPGVIPGSGVRWSDEYDNRDTAVKAGISPTFVASGAVTLKNVVTFYRPDTVAQANNGYRSMRNISIIQNLDYSSRNYFSQENWSNITIVADAKRVTNPIAQAKAKDVQAVKNALTYLAGVWEGEGWIFTKDITVASLAEAGSVILRQGGTGFDYNTKVVLSGEGGILNQLTIFDINFGG